MSITLYTPATGFPDLEAKIAYGLARVGIEAFGMEKITIHDEGGFYTVVIGVDENESAKLEKTLNLLCKRLLSSEYIPIITPGIKKSGKRGGFVGNITVKEDESFGLRVFQQTGRFCWNNTKDEPVCGHSDQEVVGAVLGLAAESSYHHSRDKLDFEQKKDKDKYYIGRPSNPKRICKVCGLLSLIGMWYSSFVFNIVNKLNKQYKVVQEIVTIPVPKQNIKGSRLQEIFSLQHQIRKDFLPELPQTLIPLAFLSKIPSSADILEGFDLFVAVLSRQQGYHVDGLFLIPIENYLDFIRQTPYNIATIDNMLNTFGNKRYPKEAYDALIELNNAIYYHKLDSLLKFARLYVLETTPKDSKDWTNLLYPETTKYLLKEVAMIKEEIIKNKSVRFIAKTLGYFVWNKDYQNYSFADGLRNAKTSKDVRQIFEKLEREAKLRYDQEKNKQNGNPPHLPHPDDIEQINHLMQLGKESFEQVITTLYLLAFSFESYKTIKIESREEVQDA